jgi:hypothetical protein
MANRIQSVIQLILFSDVITDRHRHALSDDICEHECATEQQQRRYNPKYQSTAAGPRSIQGEITVSVDQEIVDFSGI